MKPTVRPAGDAQTEAQADAYRTSMNVKRALAEKVACN